MQTRQEPEQSENQLTVAGSLRDLQRETFQMVLPGVFIAGLTFLLVEILSKSTINLNGASYALIALTCVVWTMRSRSYLAAVWVLIIGLSGFVWLLTTIGGISPAVYLLSLPAGLAVLFLNVQAGVALSVAFTLMLASVSIGAGDQEVLLRFFATMQIWGVVGLMGMAANPLITAAGWAWSSYERSRELLEAARGRQVQLKQALADLAAANVQLERVNDFARRMREEAENARSTKERFVANVSHELRTPLNMVIGFAELLTSSPKSYGGNVERHLLADLNIILRNSRHLSALIDDVLDLSQIEAGHMALLRESVDLGEVVEAARTAVSQLFSSRELYLEVDVQAGLPSVWCDRTRIREVLLNLLSNAARFTESGGVQVRVGREGNDIITEVTDTGPGISTKDLDRLFQPFEQLDGSIRRRHGGSGLGLSISKGFVELHGGKMWIESEEGHGTRVFFRLPIAPPEPLQTAAAGWLRADWEYHQGPRPTAAAPASPRPRLVVVEKGSTLKRLLARYENNVEVAAFSTLEQAAADLADMPARALLINDASMTEALQQVTTCSLPAGIPVIICAVPEAPEAAHALGATDYLVKPVSQERLFAALERLDLKKRSRILIVDDEPEAQLLFRRMLASSDKNYRVITAENGMEALTIMRQRNPDVALLDLVMPDMDGFHVLAKCQEDPILRKIPIVLMSAKDPTGQPLVSKGLAVTQGDGLTAQQLLASIEALQAILSPGHPKSPGNHAV